MLVQWSMRVAVLIVSILVVFSSNASALNSEDIHPDWVGSDPFVWRLQLDTGNNTALYLVGDKLLVQYPDLRTLIVNRDGEVEQELAAPYDLGTSYMYGGGSLLGDAGVVYMLDKPVHESPETAGIKTEYELLEMDFLGSVLDRHPLNTDISPLWLVAENNGLVLLFGGFEMDSRDNQETGVLLAFSAGELLWQRNLSQFGINSFAILDDGTVIYNDSESLFGVSIAGAELWTFEDENSALAQIVSLDGQSVFVAFGYGSDKFHKFDSSGHVWSQTGFQDVYLQTGEWRNCIKLADGSTIISDVQSALIMLDQLGNRVWSRLTDYGAGNITKSDGETFFISDFNSGLAALDLNGHYLWTEPRFKWSVDNLTYDQGLLYLIFGNELYCIDTTAYARRDPVVDDQKITYYAAKEQERIRWQVPAEVYLYGSDFVQWMDPPKVDNEGYIYFQNHRSSGLQIMTSAGEIHTSVYECGAEYGEFTVKPDGGLFLIVEESDWSSMDYKLLLSDLGCADRDGNPLFKNDVMEFGRMSELQILGDALFSLGDSVTRFGLDGSIQWSVSAGEDSTAEEICSLLDGGIAVRLSGKVGEETLVLDENGTEVSRFNLEYGNLGPVATSDGALVFHRIGEKIYAVDQTGELLWEHEYSTDWESVSSWNCGSPISSGETVYAGTADGKLIAFSSTGEVLWEYSAGSPVSTPALGADGTIYASALQKSIFALSPDGEELWSLSGLGFIVSPPVLGIDGAVLVLSESALLALEP